MSVSITITLYCTNTEVFFLHTAILLKDRSRATTSLQAPRRQRASGEPTRTCCSIAKETLLIPLSAPGAAYASSTLVTTAEGKVVEIGSVRRGDRLLGPDGSSCEVLDVTSGTG